MENLKLHLPYLAVVMLANGLVIGFSPLCKWLDPLWIIPLVAYVVSYVAVKKGFRSAVVFVSLLIIPLILSHFIYIQISVHLLSMQPGLWNTVNDIAAWAPVGSVLIWLCSLVLTLLAWAAVNVFRYGKPETKTRKRK